MDKFKPMTIKATKQKIYQTTDASQPAGIAPLEVKEAWQADRGGWRQGFEDGIGKQRERSELHTSEHKKKGYRLDLQSYNNQKGEAHFAFQEKDAVYGQVHLEYDPKIPDHVPGKTIGKALVAAMGECLDTRTIWEVKYDEKQDKQKIAADLVKKKAEERERKDKKHREKTRKEKDEYNELMKTARKLADMELKGKKGQKGQK